MKLESRIHVIRDDPVLQISETGQDDDGGLRPLSYWVQRDVPGWPGLVAKAELPEPKGPPRLPRLSSLEWSDLALGCIVGVSVLATVVGLWTMGNWVVGVVRWAIGG